MKINSYLFFDGHAEEALAYYAKALGGTIETIMRYADCPDPVPPEYMPPGGPQKIMHGSLLIGEERLMMSDGVPTEGGGFRGFSLAVSYETEAEARRVFDALAAGGRVVMPIGPTFFSPCYGMLTDRYGVEWMVMTAAETQPAH